MNRILAALLALVMLLACVPAMAEEAAVVSDAAGELTIWIRTNATGTESLYGIWGNEPTDPYYQYLKQTFPNVKFNFVINKGWGEIAAAVAAGDAPDLFFFDGNADLIMPQLLAQGLVEPLNGYIENDASFVNNFVPGVLDTLTVDGTLYALPFDVMPYGIFVNYDVLDKTNTNYPALTWTMDEFVEMCQKVTNKSDAMNTTIAIARNVEENDYIRFLSMFCAAYGVKGYTEKDGKMVSNLSEDPAAIAAFEKYLEIQANNYAYTLSADERNVMGLDNSVWNIDWKAGISATFPGVSSWALIKDADGQPAFNQVFYPAFVGEMGSGAPLESIDYAIYAGSKNKELAWTYLKAMTSEEFRNNAWAVNPNDEGEIVHIFKYDEDTAGFTFGLPPFTTEYELNDDFAKLYNGLAAAMYNPYTLYVSQWDVLEATRKVARGEMQLVDALKEYDDFVNANNMVAFPAK